MLNDDGVNAATPFAQGAGHVDLTKAAETGFVLDVTTAEYGAADPAIGGDPKGPEPGQPGQQPVRGRVHLDARVAEHVGLPGDVGGFRYGARQPDTDAWIPSASRCPRAARRSSPLRPT